MSRELRGGSLRYGLQIRSGQLHAAMASGSCIELTSGEVGVWGFIAAGSVAKSETRLRYFFVPRSLPVSGEARQEKIAQCMNAQNESNSPNPEQPSHDAGASQEAEKLTSKPELLPTPNELVALLSKRVIGNEQAKRSIAVAVYQHLLNCAKCDTYGGRVETENHVLLVGPSGSGKSLLLRTG